ncbi:WD repeat-containing protein [Saitoella complicata NRRL Y-17804]|uniref:WD repeat-containing protein n=1 Tax=Saitoella complicata (strain BCRC 22490 / CBS 7301 / JCM 7358 / NBRC 10748 / NRRL Y-17804) TaxID=698492 RepID=UPI000867D530|nr:WD repeat-containing protein [Saitoella complicata NRRL Y-17804]ODQ54409.1 WD repeat-containing protein [Saitoella complicata NRRL Y-17804]
MTSTIKIDSRTLSSFKTSKQFKDNVDGKPITSMGFDDSGEWLITSADDSSMHLYNCKTGTHTKKILSQKYGCDLAMFTHHSQNVVHSSTKGNDHTVRYMSLHDNSYIRYFRGHDARVTSLQLCPSDDHIISAGLDNTVRLWDLRSSTAHGVLNIPTPAIATFDNSGMIFAVASHVTSSILLYDLRSFDKEPFSTFRLTDDKWLSTRSFPPRMPEWTTLAFSNDGSQILVGTSGDAHYTIDAFSGQMRTRLTGHQPTNFTRSTGDVCFTPDGRYVIGGSGDKNLCVWDTHAPTRDKLITPEHILGAAGASVPHVVGFNPRSAMLATASTELTFWLPDV